MSVNNAELLAENRALRKLVKKYETKLQMIEDYIKYYERKTHDEREDRTT